MNCERCGHHLGWARARCPVCGMLKSFRARFVPLAVSTSCLALLAAIRAAQYLCG